MKGQSKFLKIILLAGDICFIYLALFLTVFFRDKSLLSQFNNFLNNFLILYFIWIFILFVLSLYDLSFFKKIKDFVFNLIIFSVLAFFIGVTYFYFRPTFGITPKTILLLNVLIFDGLFMFWRYLFNLFLEMGGVKEKVVIVGFYKRLNEILPQIKKMYSIESIFCTPHMNELNKCMGFSSNVKIISDISELKNIILEKKVTSVIFSLDFYSNESVIKEVFTSLPLTLNYIGIDELYESITRKISLDHLDEVWFLEKVSRSEDIFRVVVKRMFDVVFSVIGLVCFVACLPFVAVAIKLDSKGGVFYSQQRVGKNGKVFYINKFRTMEECGDDDKGIWREKDTNSITRVGKILRRSHIDELPQAWSILKGDISFVGPRPEWIEFAKKFEEEIPFYKQRYLVKPGLIGWAQINFPASTSVKEAKEKFEYDLYYIKNQSLLLDLEIILKTVKLFIF